MPEHLAWFHCFAGIAGDMALGALLDAGADLAEVQALLLRLPIGEWALEAEATTRNGLGATRAVVVDTSDDTVVRTYAHVTALLEEARLPHRVRDRAAATFAAIARVEGELHRRPAEQVQLHEMGGTDAIIDVVGVAAALEVLAVERVLASEVAVGTGVVRSAHGLAPNPAPAVVGLLEGVPTRGLDVPYELTTSTGAGLLAALADGFGPLPAMTVAASGFGAGARELDDLPNLTQVVLGTAGAGPAPGQPLVLLEANVDDLTGAELSAAVAALLDDGATEAWVTPVVLGRGRPAHTVSALADPALVRSLAATLARETGSLAVRGSTVEAWPAPRQEGAVEVDGSRVRVAVGPGRVRVDHEDAARAGRRAGLPVREVVSRAEEAWRRTPEDDTVVALPIPDPGPPDEAG